MEIDRHVKFLGTLVDRPEFLEVEELPVRHAVQHCPLEAEFGDRALEFARRGLGVGGWKRGETGKAVGVRCADLGQTIVNIACELGCDIGTELLSGWRAMRKDLDVDAGLVHLLETQAPQVIEPLVRLTASPGFGAGEMLGQFRVPVVLLDGNDWTIRLEQHGTSPRTLLEPLRINWSVGYH